MSDPGVIELDDEAWAKAREEAAQYYFGISADEFAARLAAGAYDGDEEPDFLMELLSYFPELD